MADIDGDGIPDVLEGALRTGVAEVMRAADMSLAARRERLRAATMDARDAARADESRLSTLASVSREKLRPVMGEQWWARSTPERAAEMYGEARAWDGIHPQEAYFQPYAKEIERRAAEKHDMSPADLWKAAYGTENAQDQGMGPHGEVGTENGGQGPRSMTSEEVYAVQRDHAPQWYGKAYSAATHPDQWDNQAEAARSLAPMEQGNAEAMAHLRDTGNMDHPWAQKMKAAAERMGLDTSVEPTPMDAQKRMELGAEPAREQGGRLSLDQAHTVASSAAPDWYRVPEKLDAETDPEAKAKLENRLRDDMTTLVDTGQLETDSAKEEWKDYSGRDVSVEAAWRADRMDREKPGVVPADILESRSQGSGPATEPVPVVPVAEHRDLGNGVEGSTFVAGVSGTTEETYEPRIRDGAVAREEKAKVKQAAREANADASEKPAAGKEERSEKTPGTGWDSAGRRERREAKLREQGFSEDAIAGQRATDWSMRSRRGADAGQPAKVDASHIQRMRQQSQQKGPGRGV